ncbi:MAG: DUF4190 domain-containing protein [Phycisphaerales bacterium]|nr:DUF4190 domain-containing protein [Phycisphaerales bacterium]
MTHFDPQRGSVGLDDFEDSPGTNILGIVGFILSILCVTAPLGLLVSLIALAKRPRGFAVAGAIIGILFTAVLAAGIWGTFKLTKYSTGISVMGGIAVDQQLIEQQANRYNAETGVWPTDIAMVNLPPEALIDPWGKAYKYELKGDIWSITTAGPDGVFGNDDDFTIGRGEDFDNNQEANKQLIEHWSAVKPGLAETIEAWKVFVNEAKAMDQWQNNNRGMSAVAGKGPLPPDEVPAKENEEVK